MKNAEQHTIWITNHESVGKYQIPYTRNFKQEQREEKIKMISE